MYPNLDHNQTAEVLRREVLRSSIKIEGTNWKEIATYVNVSELRVLYTDNVIDMEVVQSVQELLYKVEKRGQETVQ